MYYISNDKRTQRSAALIWQGMEQCLRKKDFGKLTVSDIHEASYVSRATFYRLFDTPRDVLAYQCDMIYAELAADAAQHIYPTRQAFFLSLIEKWTKQEVLVRTLAENNMVSILYETHMKNRELMKKVFLEGSDISDHEADYLVSLLANIIPAAVNVWYQHGRTESAQEIYRSVSRSLGIIAKELSVE